MAVPARDRRAVASAEAADAEFDLRLWPIDGYMDDRETGPLDQEEVRR